ADASKALAAIACDSSAASSASRQDCGADADDSAATAGAAPWGASASSPPNRRAMATTAATVPPTATATFPTRDLRSGWLVTSMLGVGFIFEFLPFRLPLAPPSRTEGGCLSWVVSGRWRGVMAHATDRGLTHDALVSGASSATTCSTLRLSTSQMARMLSSPIGARLAPNALVRVRG